MLVINSIEKTRLSADSYSYSGTGVAWKARLVLFLGFALMAGGLAGAVVSGFTKLGVWRVIIDEFVAGGLGPQISRPAILVSNVVLWGCKCDCKWIDHAEVSTPYSLMK